MQFRIVKIVVSGMKGIEKPMTFQFLNDTINYERAFSDSSIKAVYGLNGSGKSSFINAIDVYKKICTSYSFLVENASINTLVKLINVKAKEFKISFYFICDGIDSSFCHEICINNKTGKPFIERETLSRITGQTINGKTNKLLEVNGRDLLIYSCDPLMNEIGSFVKQSIEKKNEYVSVVSLFFDINFMDGFVDLFEKKEREKETNNYHISANDASIALLVTSFFVRKLFVFLGERDVHSVPYFKKMLELLSFFNKEVDESIVVSGDKFINKNELKQYQVQVAKMTRFIKLFKPELKKINIDKRSNGKLYQCRLVMNYDTYSIDYEYESTGLKNLMDMFSCLEQASLGGIAFIDEMDANMNEVYLEKLCDYFVNHAKGQLCFTTHNTAPMRILQSKKNGIDFINSKEENYQWIRNGNYSPAKLYKEGMIPGLPFNLEGFDFIEVFSPEEA